MRIGFLGPEGTFSEEASKIYLRRVPGKKQLIPVGLGGPAIKCQVNIGGK